MNLSASVLKVVVIFASLAVLTSCVSKKKYEEAMTRAAAEKSALESALSDARAKNDQLAADFSDLEKNLSMSKEEIQSLSSTIATNNKKIEMLKDAISEAFETYDADDVKVELRNGKLYITMANSILFDAGRDKLAGESKEVIATLAGVLKDNTEMNLLVEGHTDGDPVKIHRSQYTDNWGLSVARASNVVRELEANGVAPSRLTSSGKGSTQPVASNDTDEGKEANRRTEFVIAPELDGLYKMYKSEFANVNGDN
ncbi:MAG: OmpA family protein [Bacteroidia bacterium]|nr:OmpA family protein [Bacteroidia bacterium]